jgi:membrane protease YdiL (CAAX protease family)
MGSPNASEEYSFALASASGSLETTMANQIDQEKLTIDNRVGIFCDVLALIFTMGYPSLMSWLEFVLLRGASRDGNLAIQLTFWLGKVVQFSFPIVYVWFRARNTIHIEPPNKRGMLVGIAFGLSVGAGALILYFGWLRSSPAFASTPRQVYNWLYEFNPFFTTFAGYLILAFTFALVHSFMEEYYWRWFVFGRLKALLPVVPAVILSSLAFMAHHVIVLNVYLQGHFWEAVVPFSLCVAGGGIVWAWLYHACQSLYAPWISHLLIDAALMSLGFDMLPFGQGS